MFNLSEERNKAAAPTRNHDEEARLSMMHAGDAVCEYLDSLTL